jgi:AmmeMemoRadiSam system protein A
MKDILLKIARESILEELEGKQLINKDELIKNYPFLSEQRATFVTLKINKNLRGCIGSILPRMSLIDDVIYNAKQAAFTDPRFYPLTPDEYKQIHIEVSILTIPEKLEYENPQDLKRKIRPKIDGVILSLADKQATFLPSVWDELPIFEIFFGNLCMKAGMQGDCLKYHPLIYTYQAEIIEE